jgi:hypothetical protein
MNDQEMWGAAATGVFQDEYFVWVDLNLPEKISPIVFSKPHALK